MIMLISFFTFCSFLTKTCIRRGDAGVGGQVHGGVRGHVGGPHRPRGGHVGGGEGGVGHLALELGKVGVGQGLARCDPPLGVEVQHLLETRWLARVS